jgi:hypothetical protein
MVPAAASSLSLGDSDNVTHQMRIHSSLTADDARTLVALYRHADSYLVWRSFCA